jgi:hypothetical protein
VLISRSVGMVVSPEKVLAYHFKRIPCLPLLHKI